MDISSQIVTPALMAVFALLLGWFGRGQFRSLKEEMATVREGIAAVEGRLGARIDRGDSGLGARIDALENNLGARIDKVESGLGARIDRVEHQIVALHSDLTQVALAVGVRPRAENG